MVTPNLRSLTTIPTMNFSEILNLFRQGKGSVKSHMRNLIEMAAADKNFDDSEFDLLKSIARKNNISDALLMEIRSNPSAISFELPSDKRERFHQFYDLVHMMSIDKSIHEDELILCKLFAGKFGYKKENQNELIESIRLNIQNKQSHDETMKRVERMIV
jgi:uncharacterized tellurite resistance protein B-like protein